MENLKVILNNMQSNKTIFIKQLFLSLATVSLIFLVNTANAEIKLTMSPSPVIRGEPAQIEISSTEGDPVIDNLPEIPNLQWIDTNSQVSSMTIYNGKRSSSKTYSFIVSKPGIVTIPSLEIQIGSQKIYTQEKNIRVVQGSMDDIDKQLFIKCLIPLDNKQEVYLGETVPLKINLYKADRLNATPIEFPNIQIKNVAFDNFSKYNNQGSDRFATYPYGAERYVTENDINYTKSTFYTSFKPLGTGTLKGSVSLLCNITIPTKKKNRASRLTSMLNDDFFGRSSIFNDSFFSRGKQVSKLLSCKIPELKILPLPPLPGDSQYIGLIGQWDIKADLSMNKLKEGEPVTLSFKIKGKGSLDSLAPPELSIPGFTVYPPEIQKKEANLLLINDTSEATINYVLIPVEPGKTNINVSLAVFNVKDSKYKTSSINKTIDIANGNFNSNSIVFQNNKPNATTSSYTPKKFDKVSNVILYLNKKPGNNVLIPLWRNNIILFIILILLGPLLWVTIEFIFFKKNRVDNNIKLQRKNRAQKNKNSVLKSLKKVSSDNLSDIVNNEVIPYINDLKGLPPGTTADELSSKLNNHELTNLIKEADSLRYLPSSNHNILDLKQKMISMIKKLSLVLIIFSASFFINSSLSANDNQKQNTIINSISDLTEAYNSANFIKAEEICKANIKSYAPNPAWLYNLGNCYFQTGNLSKALLCYERALRLDPRNSDILENLNFVRRKLFLPEIYQTKTPLAVLKYIRDNFRPDQWMIIFAIGLFIFFMALILRKFSSQKIWISIISIGIVIAAISVIAYFSEISTIYNSNDALVVERNIKVYTLPSKESSKSNFKLAPGNQIRIEEVLNKWIRIRKENSEGWVNKDSIKKIWPY